MRITNEIPVRWVNVRGNQKPGSPECHKHLKIYCAEYLSFTSVKLTFIRISFHEESFWVDANFLKLFMKPIVLNLDRLSNSSYQCNNFGKTHFRCIQIITIYKLFNKRGGARFENYTHFYIRIMFIRIDKT